MDPSLIWVFFFYHPVDTKQNANQSKSIELWEKILPFMGYSLLEPRETLLTKRSKVRTETIIRRGPRNSRPLKAECASYSRSLRPNQLSAVEMRFLRPQALSAVDRSSRNPGLPIQRPTAASTEIERLFNPGTATYCALRAPPQYP